VKKRKILTSSRDMSEITRGIRKYARWEGNAGAVLLQIQTTRAINREAGGEEKKEAHTLPKRSAGRELRRRNGGLDRPGTLLVETKGTKSL